MTTKYVLCGGAAHIPDPRNDSFYREILKDTPSEVNILVVLFAKEGEKVTTNYDEGRAQFNRVKGDKILSFKIADKSSFLEQASWADVIFSHGGSPQIQLPIYKTFSKADLQDIFKGKVVAGDSAGVYFLADYVYSNFQNQLYRGLGLLPIKLICHYTEGVEKHIDTLPADLEEVFLSEYQYRVFTARL